jgi:hypothetical protein
MGVIDLRESGMGRGGGESMIEKQPPSLLWRGVEKAEDVGSFEGHGHATEVIGRSLSGGVERTILTAVRTPREGPAIVEYDTHAGRVVACTFVYDARPGGSSIDWRATYATLAGELDRIDDR